VATGSTDTSIKLLDVEKMKMYNQMKTEHGEDYAPARPVIRTFYDHIQVNHNNEFNSTL
jgi:cleavage stimulation factor subunit 1